MALTYQTLVAEDLDLGHGTVSKSMPGGGTATGNKINLATFQESTGELYSALPAASVGKGQLRVVRDSSTATAGATIAGGGANFVLAWSNGTNWLVVR
jgi:hypothetical protein